MGSTRQSGQPEGYHPETWDPARQEPDKQAPHVKQAANVVELLEYFARRGEPATLAEIADALGWPRSSTFNIVGTLVEKGYFYEPRLRGGYYPSPRWKTVVGQIATSDPLPDVLRDMVDEIGDRIDETTALAAASGRYAIFLHVRESRQPVRYFAEIGTRAPIHAGSVGRALISQMDQKERENLYRRLVFRAATPFTPMSVAEVEAHMHDATLRGYHQSQSESVLDLSGVSFPIPFGVKRYAVVMSGPSSRCFERRPEIARIMAASIRRAGIAVPDLDRLAAEMAARNAPPTP